MPAKSEKQRKYMGMELAKKKAGKPTKTKLNMDQLMEFAHKINKGKGMLGFGKKKG